jgi:hypothetical protein
MEDALRNLLRGNELSREGLTLEERKKEILRESLAIQKDIAKGGQNYLDHMKNLKKLLKEINRVEEQISKSKKKIEDLNKKIATATDAEKATLNELIADEKIRLGLLIDRLKLEKQSAEATQIALRNSSKFSAFYKQSINDLKAIKGAWKSISSFIGGFDDVFKWEKSIKMTAMNMGVLGSRFDGFQKDMVKAATTTAQWGMDITEITKIQGAYSEELGTAVMLSEKGAARLGAMAHVTGLGAEGAGKMAGELGKVGLSAERTANFVEETMQNSSKMGINSGKVIKNIAANLKLLNKYNFKGGTKSLAKMAQYTTKMGVSMNLAGSMADKLMDVEGAVEMSSQLQVLGGEWSKLADPFKLMYMARNDMEGLTKALVGATKNSASFNAKTKEFDLSAQAMAQLREVAKATGADFEELATAAKKAANFAKIEKQIGIGFKDKETKEFIENQATFNEKGEAIIRIDGKDRLVKALNESDKQGIKRAIEEKLKMEDMAKQSQSLDELWKNTVIMLKQLLVPIVDAINKKLMPAMTGLMAKFTDPKFLDGIIEFGKQVGDIIGTVGKFMIENPKWTIAMFGVFEAAKWILNGMKLGLGFNMVAKVGGGPTGTGGGGGLFNQRNPAAMDRAGMGKMAKFGANFKSGLKSFGAVGSGMLAAGIEGYSEYDEQLEKGKSQGAAIGRGALKGAGAGLGAWGGAAAGAAIGSVVPVVGTLIGGLIGGALGAWGGGKLADLDTYGVNDGVVFNPKDKFMKVNDSTMIAGTNENGNKSLAKAIMSATVPGFGMTDYLMNSNKNAGVSGGKSIPGEVHHKFDNDMKVDGRIELVTNGEIVAKISRELLQNSSFVQSLQQSINKMNLTYGS